MSEDYDQKGENEKFHLRHEKETGNTKESFKIFIRTLASDFRLKEKITFLYKKNNLKVYSWEWNQIAEKLYGIKGKEKGFIAQEVKLSYPEYVFENSDEYYNILIHPDFL